MSNRVIGLGTKIEIRVREDNKRYLSQVEDIKDEKHITISAPINEGKIVPLSINSKYEVLFLAGTICHRTHVRVNDREKKDGIYFIDVEILNELEKFQRRNYFRFKCLLHMKYIELENEDDKIKKISQKEDDVQVFDGVVRDISGGGIRFICNNIINRGIHIQSFINLGSDIINVVSEVIRKDVISDNKFEYRSKFINVSDKSREKIIKYIFNEQRKLLKKENGA